MTHSIKVNGTAEHIIQNAEIKDGFAIIMDDLTIIKLNEYTVLVSIKSSCRRIIGSANTFDRIVANLKSQTIPKKIGNPLYNGVQSKYYYLDTNADMYIRTYFDYNTETESTELCFNSID